MLWFEQLQLFLFAREPELETAPPAVPFSSSQPNNPDLRPASGRDAALEMVARKLLQDAGASQLAPALRVEWNRRMRTAAGRADFRQTLVTLNPRLREYGDAEIDRTLRHELAHLLAHARAGRRRITPHGPEWQSACHDLGIGGEPRCHTLPFPVAQRRRRFLYRCPECRGDFPRVRRIRGAVACLACCRKFNRGGYDTRFQLKLVRQQTRA